MVPRDSNRRANGTHGDQDIGDAPNEPRSRKSVNCKVLNETNLGASNLVEPIQFIDAIRVPVGSLF
jgi:hypothetical protein